MAEQLQAQLDTAKKEQGDLRVMLDAGIKRLEKENAALREENQTLREQLGNIRSNGLNNVFPPHNLICPITGEALPPNLGGYQFVANGPILAGDLMVDAGLWTWAVDANLKRNAEEHSRIRVYRKIPVPKPIH